LDSLYSRILKLNRSAVRDVPDDPKFQAELALALGDQGLFFLDTGRGSDAETAIREALEIHQRVLAEGRLKGSIERYVARTYFRLGQVLAAAGQTRDAEESYQKAVDMLDPLVKELPESGIRRADLAWTLSGMAVLLRDTDRRGKAAAIRQLVIGHYE